MKRLLKAISLIFFSLMVICLIRQPALAAVHEDFSLFDYEWKGGVKYTEGDYQYIIIDKEAYLVKANESLDPDNTTLTGHVTVPSSLGGYPVAFIYGMCFADCDEITEITIPDSVITIGFNCFQKCDKLTTVNLGANVTTFIGQAFYECPSFTTLNWGPKVEKIGRRNFENCDALISITIPDTVTTIGEYAFAYCDNLTTVTLSENLTTLEQAVLHLCPKLESVVIPDSVQSVGRMCFERSSGLKSVVIGKGVKAIEMDAFNGCSSLITVTMNDAVERIEEYAFKGCENLESIVIPDTTTVIKTQAFEDCESMKTVTIGKNVQMIDVSAFKNCASVEQIIIPDSVTEIGNYAFSGCTSATVLQIGSNVEKIGIGGFQHCASVKEINIPDSVTSVEKEAFFGCTSAKTVTIGTGVTELKEKAFSRCTSLESISIGKELTVIGKEVFNECSSMQQFIVAEDNPNYAADSQGVLFNKDKTRLIQAPGGISGAYVLPDTVTIIDEYAFYRCKNLKKVILPDSLRTISNFGFYGCELLEEVDFGNGVEEAGSFSFGYCEKLTEINLPASFKTIGGLMFDGCNGLVDIEIPGTVETIGPEAFAYCMNLKSVKLGDGIKTIGQKAFQHCEYLESIDIPDSVETIGASAFTYCRRLASAKLGSGITEIPASAFEYADKMKSITVSENLKTVRDKAFYYADSLTDVYYGGNREQWHLINVVGYNNGRFEYANIHFAGEHDHSFKKYVSDNNATCTEDGTETAKCEFCSLTDTRVIKGSAGHIGGTATCIAVAVCERCGENYGAINASNHINTELQNVIEANCTQEGYTGDVYCFDCEKIVVSGEIQPYLHAYETQVTEPTYTMKGYTTYTCSLCGYNFEGDYVDALGLPMPTLEVMFDPATSKATLTWDECGEADNYKVYRATSKSGKYSMVVASGSDGLEIAVPAGKTYYYKVKAFCMADESLNSEYSNIVKVVGQCTQPQVVAEADEATGKPYITWSKVSGAKKYYVYQVAEDGTMTRLTSTTKTYYTHSKAVVGEKYTYVVRAIASSSSYNSIDSAEVTCLCLCAQPKLSISVSADTGMPTLSWKAITGAVSYEVYRAENGGVFTLLTSLEGTSYVDTAVAVDAEYSYMLVAVISEEVSNTSDIKTVSIPLARPVLNTYLDDVTGKPVITWETIEGATSYKVYRSTSSSKSYKEIATVTDTKYLAETASAGKTYYYKVKAVGANSESAYSSYKKLVAKCAQPVAWVYNKESNGKPYIAWEKVSGASKYYVYQVNEDGTMTRLTSTTKTYYNHTKAVVGMEYTYVVRAIASSSSRNSIDSCPVTCWAACARPELEVEILSATGKPKLEWEPVKGAVSYNIYWSDYENPVEIVFGVTACEWVDENAKVDCRYVYQVVAVAENEDCNSAGSNMVENVLVKCGKPVASAELVDNKPQIKWDKVEGVVKYYVYRSTKSGSGYKKIAEVNGEFYRDTKASKGKTYYYKIVAVSEESESAKSSYVKIKSK